MKEGIAAVIAVCIGAPDAPVWAYLDCRVGRAQVDDAAVEG
jgi:hypothetical protein